MMGMLWLGGAEGAARACSSSESLLLELSSLLEDDELLESEELPPLLSWSMTRASAISSAEMDADIVTYFESKIKLWFGSTEKLSSSRKNVKIF